MATAQAIIDAALGRSIKNTSRLADAAVELLRVLNLSLDRWVTHAAVTAPDAFEEDRTVVRDDDGAGPVQRWTIPTDMMVITRVEDPLNAGTEIPIIPQADQKMWRRLPSFTRRGSKLLPNALSLEEMDTIEDLTLTGAILLPHPALVADAIDPRWPERFDPLLEIDIARYLATKDGRAEEYAGLDAEEAMAKGLYDSWLAVRVANLTSRHGPVKARVNTSTIRKATES